MDAFLAEDMDGIYKYHEPGLLLSEQSSAWVAWRPGTHRGWECRLWP